VTCACGQVRGEKSLKIRTAPDILVLHLKRFKFTGLFGRKIDTQVAFPERLELGRYMSPSTPAQFSLVGVVVHSGPSLGSGHYFAYVKSKGGAWFQKNDSRVSVARLPSSALISLCFPIPFHRLLSLFIHPTQTPFHSGLSWHPHPLVILRLLVRTMSVMFFLPSSIFRCCLLQTQEAAVSRVLNSQAYMVRFGLGTWSLVACWRGNLLCKGFCRQFDRHNPYNLAHPF
jgi:hypothetical protein